jgi:hypothetical protein
MDLLPHLAANLQSRYEIEREIGRGGMATVFLARDVRHERPVALKVLDPELGAVLGAERFLSEIRVTANLQHPNLLPLFDSGSADGLLYYVMPYVEGETLRHRLEREHQLPIDEALAIATAVAGALDYAHKHGVIHRDLKPENILLQHGQPVVADFGIALALSRAGGERVTQTGLSLGTPQYMSPEQATGDRALDARSDIYSLGALTYEMLAGEPPMVGNTAQAIIAKLLTEEPRPLHVLRPTVPDHVNDAVLRSLEKLPADRFATAGAFAQALAGSPSPHPTRHARHTHVGTERGRSPRAMIAALAAACATAITFGVLWAFARRGDTSLLQFVLDTPGHTVTPATMSAVALSPDSRMIAYTARAGSGPVEIYVRRLDSLSARAEHLRGMAPLFTPDGKWLLYSIGGLSIYRAPVAGGASELVVALPKGWQGYGVGPDGEIAVSMAGSIWRVGDDKRLIRVVAPDSARGEASLGDPVFLDGHTLAYWIQRVDGDRDRGTVGVSPLKGGEHSVLNAQGTRPFGMLEGHLLIGTDAGTLLAYPFAVARREVTGPPVVLLDSAVSITRGGLQISLARDGTLAYLRGRSHRTLAIVDRHGGVVAEAPQELEYSGAALSPDGKRAVVTVTRGTAGGRNVLASDLWMWDVESRSLAKFAEGASGAHWTSDAKRIAYLEHVSPTHSRLVWMGADGSGKPEVLTDGPTPASMIGDLTFVADGREALIVARDSAVAPSHIYSVDLRNDRHVVTRLTDTKFDETAPSVSQDGRWLAYVSNESGRDEVYVRPYRSAGGKIRLTNDGGSAPEWIAGGSRLVYGTGGRTLVADISQANGNTVAVQRDTINNEGTRMGIDHTGERILVIRDPPGRRVVIVKNWQTEAIRRLRGR